jgi:hypothetical protein
MVVHFESDVGEIKLNPATLLMRLVIRATATREIILKNGLDLVDNGADGWIKKAGRCFPCPGFVSQI